VLDAGDPQLNIFSSLCSWKLNNRCGSNPFPTLLLFKRVSRRRLYGLSSDSPVSQVNIQATPMSGVPPRSHKMEFSFLNSNLIAPASQLFIFKCGTFPTMEEHMFGESTQVLLFLAIVGLTVVSTIDLVMQPIKQEQDIDKKH
jgi:hypothetical protein